MAARGVSRVKMESISPNGAREKRASSIEVRAARVMPRVLRNSISKLRATFSTIRSDGEGQGGRERIGKSDLRIGKVISGLSRISERIGEAICLGGHSYPCGLAALSLWMMKDIYTRY